MQLKKIVHLADLAKNSQLKVVRKTILFFAHCEISNIFTGQTLFLPARIFHINWFCINF